MATKTATAAATKNRLMVDPRLLVIRKGFNPRTDLGDIDRLMVQIREIKQKDPESGGLLHNLSARLRDDGKYEVVDGERRTTAIQRLIKQGDDFPFGVPVRLVNKKTATNKAQQLVEAFIANEQLPFKPMERAVAFREMKQSGMTLKEIEHATGYSDNTILDEMNLLEAPVELQEAVRAKKITSTVAKKIATSAKGDTAKQKKLIKQALAVGKDSKKRDALAQSLESARRTRAASKGRTLKLQPVSKVTLTELGTKSAKYLKAKLREASLDDGINNQDLRAWVAKDAERAAAYQFGTMQALQVVAGMKINLDI